MRNFILSSFFLIVISLLTISKAHSLNSFFELSFEESSDKKNSSENYSNSTNKEEKPKSIQTNKQKTAKEQKKIAKQDRKEFRKIVWKSIKEQRKINKEVKKENRKNGIKNQKIHWTAYLAIFGALVAIGIFIAAIILGTAIFNVLGPIALFLLPVSIISGIIGINAAIKDDNNKYNKTATMTLSLVGGILALLALLFLILIFVALSVAFT